MKPQFVVVPTAFLVARFLSWTPNFVRMMIMLVGTIAATALGTVVHLYQTVGEKRDDSQIWIKRPQETGVRKLLIRYKILSSHKDKAKFDRLYRATTYYQYEREQLLFLGAQLSVMTSIGLGAPTLVGIYPPLIVQSILIPLTLLTHPVFNARMLKRRLAPGCYDEVTEATRQLVEEGLE